MFRLLIKLINYSIIIQIFNVHLLNQIQVNFIAVVLEQSAIIVTGGTAEYSSYAELFYLGKGGK